MWWLFISLLPAIIVALANCGNERTTERKKPTGKSSRTLKVESKETKSKRSGKSGRSSKSGKSGRSSKSSKDSKKSTKSFSKSRLAKPVIPPPQEQTAVREQQLHAKSQEPPPTAPQVFSEPPAVYFRPTGGLDKFTVVNESGERRAFKVKCSDNQLYRFSPVAGFVPPHSSAVVEVIRQNGTVKPDKAVVMSTVAAPGTVQGAKELLASAPTSQCQMIVVPLVVDA